MSQGSSAGDAAVPGAGPRRTEVRADGVRLSCLEWGAGPLVLFLHGFPDAPDEWHRQAEACAAAGFRAVAPALRGYGASDRPRGVAAYDVDRLAADVAALVRALGERRAAAVVGHDWGGGVAWQLAARHPDVVERLVIVNSPHPRALLRALRTWSQRRRSWYMGFFQLPWLPEAVLRAGDFAILRRSLRRAVRDPRLADEAWPARRAALAPRGALTAALNYYRAAMRRILRPRDGVEMAGTIALPVLLLWGDRDPFLLPSLAEGLEQWVPRIEVRHFPRAGHWLHWDEADAVSAAIVDWLRRPVGEGAPAPTAVD